MFTSSYNDTNYGINPFTYSDQPRQFLNDILTSSSSSTTSNPNHDDPPPFSNFFYLPSPLFPPYSGVLLDLDDQTLLLQEEHENGRNLHDEPTMTTFTCNDCINAREDHQQQLTAYHELVRANEKVPLIGRRSSKRDRHSKINTAQGPRDRRMRLSLKVAREFFDVQDMLGFDKASKTVEWLLVQSKSSIEKLLAEVPSQLTMNYSCKSASSSLSECEVISGLDEASVVTGFSPKDSSKTSPSGKMKLRRTRSSSEQKPAVLQPLARAKARARARERALEKKWNRRLDESKPSEEAMNRGLNPNQSGSSWSSASGEEHSSFFKQTFNHNMNPPPPPPSLDALSGANAWIHQKQERLEAQTGCFIDDSLVIMSKWSPSSILTNHLQSTSNYPKSFSSETSNLCARNRKANCCSNNGSYALLSSPASISPSSGEVSMNWYNCIDSLLAWNL